MGHRETSQTCLQLAPQIPLLTLPSPCVTQHTQSHVELTLPRLMACVCPSNQLCSSCLAAVLVPLHTSLTAGFEEWPPTTGKCLSHSSHSRVNSCLCPRQVTMFSPQWKLCFHMSLPPMAGTSAWASVPLCMPVPLWRLLWAAMGSSCSTLCPLHTPWLCEQWGGMPLNCPESSYRALPAQTMLWTLLQGKEKLTVTRFSGRAAAVRGCTDQAVGYSEPYMPAWMTEMKHLLLSTSFKPLGACRAHPPHAPRYPCVPLSSQGLLPQ